MKSRFHRFEIFPFNFTKKPAIGPWLTETFWVFGKLGSTRAGFADPPWRHAGASHPAGGGACLPAGGGACLPAGGAAAPKPGLGKGGSSAEAGEWRFLWGKYGKII